MPAAVKRDLVSVLTVSFGHAAASSTMWPLSSPALYASKRISCSVGATAATTLGVMARMNLESPSNWSRSPSRMASMMSSTWSSADGLVAKQVGRLAALPRAAHTTRTTLEIAARTVL